MKKNPEGAIKYKLDRSQNLAPIGGGFGPVSVLLLGHCGSSFTVTLVVLICTWRASIELTVFDICELSASRSTLHGDEQNLRALIDVTHAWTSSGKIHRSALSLWLLSLDGDDGLLMFRLRRSQLMAMAWVILLLRKMSYSSISRRMYPRAQR